MPADLDSLFNDDDFNIDESYDANELDDLSEESVGQETNFEEMFRESATRSETAYEDMGYENEEFLDEETGSSGGFSISNFTPFQILILVLLVILDFAAIGFGILVLMGRIS